MEGPIAAKVTYRATQKIEVFFTGGAARITRDGKLLACTCGEQVQIVDVQTGAVLRALAGDTEPVTALAVSPDSKTLVVASRSLAVRVYDMHSGDVLRTWRPHKMPVADLAIDASGGYVATASADRTVKVWDLQGGFCTHSFTGHSGVVLRVLFHPKQLQLYSGGDDAQVRVWDLVENKCTALLKSHFSAVTSLALSSDGWVLLSGGRDKVVTAWDLRSCTKLATVPVFESVEGVVSLPLGAPFPGIPAPSDPAMLDKKGSARPVFFATAGEKGRIKLWRSDTAACVYEHAGLGAPLTPTDLTTPAPSAAPVTSASQEYNDLMLVPGGAALLATTADARLMFYKSDEARSGLRLSRQLVGNVDEVTDVRLVGGTRTQPTHVAVATNCEVIQLFELEGLSCTASCMGHRETVLALDAAWLPVGPSQGGTGVLVSGAKDNEVRVWEMPTGRCLAVGVGHVGSVGAVALARRHPNKFVVSAGADKLLKVWDLAAVLEADAQGTSITAAAAPPSKKSKKEGGKAVGAVGVQQMRASAATAAHDKDINSVAVSPNDMLVATGSQDRTARVWKLPSLTPHMVLRGHKRGVWAVEFSPVDQALITASGDKTIKMWSLSEGGSCIRTFEGHQGSVLRASFITAGTQIISAGADGLVKLWSVRSDECVSTFDEHQGKIWAMTAGGGADSMVVTGGSDACVCMWSDVTQSDAAAAEEAAEKLVGKEQDLANALADGDFSSAAKLAFELRHPGRLLSVVQRAAAVTAGAGPMALALGPTSSAVAAGQHTHQLLANLVHHMTDEDLKVALEYCREWNANSRHCHAAQAMLRALLKHKKPAQLMTVPGLGELVEGLLSYSTRHYSRVDRLLRSTHLLDYSLAAMKVLSPDNADDGDGAGHMGGHMGGHAATQRAFFADEDARVLTAPAPVADVRPTARNGNGDGNGKPAARDGVTGQAVTGRKRNAAGASLADGIGGVVQGEERKPNGMNGHAGMNGHVQGGSSGDSSAEEDDSDVGGEGEDEEDGQGMAGVSGGSLEPVFDDDEGGNSEELMEGGSEDEGETEVGESGSEAEEGMREREQEEEGEEESSGGFLESTEEDEEQERGFLKSSGGQARSSPASARKQAGNTRLPDSAGKASTPTSGGKQAKSTTGGQQTPVGIGGSKPKTTPDRGAKGVLEAVAMPMSVARRSGPMVGRQAAGPATPSGTQARTPGPRAAGLIATPASGRPGSAHQPASQRRAGASAGNGGRGGNTPAGTAGQKSAGKAKR